MSNPNDMLSISEVAALLGRSVQAVRNYIRNEDLPHRKMGVGHVVLRSDLEEWANRAETIDLMARGDEMLRRLGQRPGVNQMAKATA